MYQQTTVVGNLGRDPEMRFTPKGDAVTTFSVAVNDGYGEKKSTIWFEVSVWGNQAESCKQYLKKGQQVLVTGRLVADESGNPKVFERKDGSFGSSFQLSAKDVRFGSKQEQEEESYF